MPNGRRRQQNTRHANRQRNLQSVRAEPVACVEPPVVIQAEAVSAEQTYSEQAVEGIGRISSRVESVDRDAAANTISRGWRRLVEMRRARRTPEEMRERLPSVESESQVEVREDIQDVSAHRSVSEMVRFAQMNAIHGLARGNARGNARGSFWISGTTEKVLSKGVSFGPNGDQRWGKGMNGREYCPTMEIVGVGENGCRHCVCNCSYARPWLLNEPGLSG